MKKGSAFVLIAITLMFAAFTAGMLVGRSINHNNVTIQPLTEPSATETRTQSIPPDNTGKLNINTASAEALDALPGIGPVLAQRIIAYREEKGPFSSISELTQVEGIGEERLLLIYDMITVED